MQSLAGTTWRVIAAHAPDAAGADTLPLGPHPIGSVTFDAERMIGAIGDGRNSLPPGAPPRFFVAYTGFYRFDGVELVTRVDDASNPHLMVDQVRHLRFESETRMVAIPVSGMPDQQGIEVVWERIA